MLARWCHVVAVIALAGSPAHADPAAAERLEREAESLAGAGNLSAAAAKYRDAFREDPRPDLMCNVGVAYYKAKDLPRAHRYLDQCVTTGAALDREFITTVKTVLTAVEDTLRAGDFKPLNFVIQPQAATTTFASGPHDEALVGSRLIWVPFASYTVTIHAEGFTDRVLAIVADDRERGDFSVKLEPAAPPPVDTTKPARDAAEPLPPGPERPPEGRSYIAPIIASAATGAFGGLALGFYLSARSKASEANETRDMSVYNETSDTAKSRQTFAIVAGGVAGVSAIVAGYLWYRAASSKTRVEVSATATNASLSLVGRF